MKEKNQVGKNLIRGDRKKIAMMVGCDKRTVAMMLRGERNQETELGVKVMEATRIIEKFNLDNNLI